MDNTLLKINNVDSRNKFQCLLTNLPSWSSRRQVLFNHCIYNKRAK